MSKLDQLIRFLTDASGLERTFRFLQALTQTILFIPPSQSLILYILAFITPAPFPEKLPKTLTPKTIAILSALRTRFALGRRFFRIARFLDAFNQAWSKYHGTQHKGVVEWLDISAKSFNGMYLLLETATFPEALAVEGLGVWGKHVKSANVEAQRFWFFALACGVLGAAVKLWRGEGKGKGKGKGGGEKGKVRKGEKEGSGKGEKEKEIGEEIKVKEKEKADKLKKWKVQRRMVADALDLVVPGAVVGWIPASQGTVGLVMLLSTWLTGLEVWEKCEGK
ncbi:hypothetical protein OQA88_9025 [Cercophora sp. LCS_1]